MISSVHRVSDGPGDVKRDIINFYDDIFSSVLIRIPDSIAWGDGHIECYYCFKGLLVLPELDY